MAIIDDESDIVNLLHDALSKIGGLSIFTFTDPMAALEHFKINKGAYALLISDLRMPGISGTDLVYKIKKYCLLFRSTVSMKGSFGTVAFSYDEDSVTVIVPFIMSG